MPAALSGGHDCRLEAARRPRGEVLRARRAEMLVLIHSQAVALVCWQRRLSPVLQRWLMQLPLKELHGGQAIMPASRVHATLRAMLDEWPAGRGRGLFLRDIETLAWRFASVARASWLRLRLDVVSGDACRFFHVDHVPLRLVTTYLGRGTEYLPPDAVGLHCDGSPMLDFDRIESLAPGHVALFRGVDARHESAPLVLHRSPPIARTQERRLLLVIDLAEGSTGAP